MSRAISILIALACFSTLSRADEPSDGKPRKATAVILRDMRPSSFIDRQTGQADGFGVELLNILAKQEGIEITYTNVGSWAEAEAALRNGSADLCPVLSVTDERKEYISFTETTETYGLTVNVRANDQGTRGLNDLKGRPVAVIRASQAHELLKNNPDLQLREYDSFEVAIFDLLSGHVDAFVAPSYIVRRLVHDAGMEDQVRILAPPLKEVKRAVGVRKEQRALFESLNRAVSAFVSTPEYQHLYVKWFGKPVPFWSATRVAMLMGAIILAVVLGMAVWRYASLLRLNRHLKEIITERKRVEDALRDNEKRLREVQELARLGYWYWDVRTGEVRWSEQVYKIFGLDPREFTPRIDSILALSPWPEDHERDKELIRKAMESHEKGDYEQRFLRPDQSIGHYYSTFQGTYDEADTLISIFGSVMDVTERKRAEQAVRDLNADLERRVEERTAQLASANNALNEFAYAVSHDLKAPLRAVNQLAQWIAEDYAGVLDDEGKSKLNLMNGRIARMHNLIDGILQYSRIGRAEEDRKPIDLDLLVRALVEALSPPAHIRVNVKGPFPTVTADPTRMEQVFQNLIGNAIKFMDKPEGLITVECEDTGDRWRFRVADNGPGIDPKYHEKVFGIFQTLAPRDQQESTGIGLALVKKIVEGYGGKVELASEIGKGCDFSFTLPK